MATTKLNRIYNVVLSVALLLGVIGVASLIGDLIDYRQGIESRKWLPTTGQIKAQTIRLLNRDGGINHFALNASYVYHIGERAYRSERVAFPNELLFAEPVPQKFSAENKTKSMFARYAPDAAVTVFYNPSANDQSTLTRGASARHYLLAWLRDLVLVAVGASLAFWRLRKRARSKQTT